MQATQDLIDVFAERIEHAYRLRYTGPSRFLVPSRVWSEAASILLSVHENDLAIPPDPELFVASQSSTSVFGDPWAELAGPDSASTYRRRVAAIVRNLTRELTEEVRYAEGRIAAGGRIGEVLRARSRRISDLGRYIVARRAGRTKLAARLVEAAADQHRACPLYRLASRHLLSPSLYPVAETSDDFPLTHPRRGGPSAYLN